MHCMAPASFTRPHMSTGYRTVPLLCQENPIQRNHREAVFFTNFNYLATKELDSVFRPFATFRSAALGEEALICSNLIMIRTIVENRSQGCARAAVSETQLGGTMTKTNQHAPPLLDQW